MTTHIHYRYKYKSTESHLGASASLYNVYRDIYIRVKVRSLTDLEKKYSIYMS